MNILFWAINILIFVISENYYPAIIVPDAYIKAAQSGTILYRTC